MVWRVDAASALADLTEVSSQIEAAAVLDGSGDVIASTGAGEERLARAAADLLRVAEERLGRAVRQAEARFGDGSLVVVRGNGRVIVARTRPRPHSALVRHDLSACLTSLDPPTSRKAARKREPARA